MRVAGLPVVAELGHRLLLALRDEHRVVAEPLRPARLLGDAALEDPRAAVLLALGPDQHELADVPGPACIALDPAQLVEQLRVRVLARRVAGRANPGRAPQRLDLEPRVLAEHPRLRGPDLPPEERLPARVLVVAVAPLLRVALGSQQLELPVRQERGQLAQLVRVLRAEPCGQSVQRAPSTCSTSASFAITSVASAPLGSSTSSSDVAPVGLLADLERVQLDAEVLDRRDERPGALADRELH